MSGTSLVPYALSIVAAASTRFRTSSSEIKPAATIPRQSECLTSDKRILPRRSGSIESHKTRTSASRRVGTPCRSSALRRSLRLISWQKGDDGLSKKRMWLLMPVCYAVQKTGLFSLLLSLFTSDPALFDDTFFICRNRTGGKDRSKIEQGQ